MRFKLKSKWCALECKRAYFENKRIFLFKEATRNRCLGEVFLSWFDDTSELFPAVALAASTIDPVSIGNYYIWQQYLVCSCINISVSHLRGHFFGICPLSYWIFALFIFLCCFLINMRTILWNMTWLEQIGLAQ